MDLIDNIFDDTNDDFVDFMDYDNEYDEFEDTNDDFADFMDEGTQWYDALDESMKRKMFKRVLEATEEK